MIRGFHLIPPVLQRGIRGKRKEPRQTKHMRKSRKGIMIVYVFLTGLIFKCSFAKMSWHLNIIYHVWGKFCLDRNLGKNRFYRNSVWPKPKDGKIKPL